MADFERTIDLDKGLNKILDKIDQRAEELRKRSEDAGDAIGDGFEDGIDDAVKKIQASSIKTEKAFNKLSEKIRKQVQQFGVDIDGKNLKVNVDFSDIDINSDEIKNKVRSIMRSMLDDDLIEFDTKGSEQQFKNVITLFTKYKEKFTSLKQAFPTISVPKDAINNLQQQLALAEKLKEIYRFFNEPSDLAPGIYTPSILKDLQVLQQVAGSSDKKSTGNYKELSDVLQEIQLSLKVISDVVSKESNALQSMAQDGTTSFESLSQAIIGVYNNLSNVQQLVDKISQKDFNITNVTQTASSQTSNRQSVKQLKAEVEAEMKHVQMLFEEADKFVAELTRKRKSNEMFKLLGAMGGIDEASGLPQSLTYKDFEQSIVDQMSSAKTKAKIENMLVFIDGYITKLQAANKLREEFGLGEWSDPFVPSQLPSMQQDQHESQQTLLVTDKPSITHADIQSSTTSDQEAQQMGQLKNTVDEVSKAIGRKNAGFIKEKEIVEHSVDAEKAKLRELINVLNDEICVTLDNIKNKFEQSFVVPELDKTQLQTSFDEIYNKFIELKDKIGTMQIDIGINTANITTAIQEALYAKEIAKNYKKASFSDLFKPYLFGSWGKDEYEDQLTGEIISRLEAEQRYTAIEDAGVTYFTNQLGTIIGETKDVIDHIVTQSVGNTAPEQTDWVQVIVEAINTQGGKIVESIKLLLPKSVTDTIDESNLISAFDTLTKAINDLLANNVFYDAKAYFTDILHGNGMLDNDVKNAMTTLGLISSDGQRKFKLASTGGINEGTVLGDNFVVSTQPKSRNGVPDIAELMKKQNKVYEMGGAVPRIISGLEDNNGNVFQLQTRAPGVNHRDKNSGLFGASPEQIDRLLYTFEKLIEVGLYPEFGGDNVMYHPKKGFTIIDLDLKDRHGKGLDNPDNMVEAFLNSANKSRSGDYTEQNKFEKLVRDRYALPADQRLVNANTIAAEKAQQTISHTGASDVKLRPIMDEGAIAKVVEENVAKTPATVKITPVIDADKITSESQDGIKALTAHLVEQLVALDDISDTKDRYDAKKTLLDNNSILREFNDKTFLVDVGHGLYEDYVATQLEDFIRDNQDADILGPIIKSAMASQMAVGAEGQTAIDAAAQFVEAANAKLKFVEANKQVTQSAEESASSIANESGALQSIKASSGVIQSIEQESETHQQNAEAILAEAQAEKDLARVKDAYNNDDQHIYHEDVYKYNEDKAAIEKKIAKTITTDKDGNEVKTIITTIVQDFEKFNKEEKKTEATIDRAKSKLNEFIKKFKSKTGGNAQFVKGFSELSGLDIDATNIEFAFNKMTELQAAYNELETNFRKGQSSLNPFTNAITKASNIDNIFGEVEYKFNALGDKSETLVTNFTRLKELSTQIKEFVNAINTDPASIRPDDFVGFSQQVGEFNLLKMQIEGTIKRDKRAETDSLQKQKQSYEEILRLIKERNDAQIRAAKSEDGSIKQKNALTDAYHIDQQLHDLGKKIVLTETQRAELARIRAEQARKIRDIEADNQNKTNKQKQNNLDKKRKQEVEDYIQLVKQKNEYDLKAAKGGAMQSIYSEKSAKLKEQIEQHDKRGLMNQDQKNRLLKIEEEHQRKIAELKEKQDSLTRFSKQNDTIQSKFDAGYLSESNFNNWKNEFAEYQNYLNGTVQADEATIEKKKTSLTQLYDQLNKMGNSAKTFFASGGEILSTWFTPQEIQNAEEALRGLYAQVVNTRFSGMETAIKNVNGEVGKLAFTVNDGEGHLSAYTLALNKATGATKLLSGYTKDVLTPLQQFGSALKGDLRGVFTAFIGGLSVLHTVGNYIRDGIQSVRELDAALTELKKVTDETEETYDNFLQTAMKTGERIGSTLSNVTSATAEFAKLGYNIKEAASMAEAALVYTNVGDNIDVETGSQSIISTLKAFGIEADNTMSIVDKFNEIGKINLPVDNYIG